MGLDGCGWCQGSIPVFRMALSAGLPITQRHVHSIQVACHGALGLNAAYDPAKNLRFRNDTAGPVLIQTRWDLRRATLRVALSGVNDGRRVRVQVSLPQQRRAAPPPSFMTNRRV